jgi:hypothetical protein
MSDDAGPALPLHAASRFDCVQGEITAYYGVSPRSRTRQRRALLHLDRLLVIATRRAELSVDDDPPAESTSTAQ